MEKVMSRKRAVRTLGFISYKCTSGESGAFAARGIRAAQFRLNVRCA
jgi:hypothetical protein